MDGGGTAGDGGTGRDTGAHGRPPVSGGCCSVLGAVPSERGAFLVIGVALLGIVLRRRRR
jgi:hypothetical protein